MNLYSVAKVLLQKNSRATSAGGLECFLVFSYLIRRIPKPPRIKPDIIIFIIIFIIMFIIMGMITEGLCNALFFISILYYAHPENPVKRSHAIRRSQWRVSVQYT